MTGVGATVALVGIGVTISSLGLIVRGMGAGGLFEKQARLAQHIWPGGVALIALGVVLVLVGAIIGA